MKKRGSPYTKANPWKRWPQYLPCFCGSGKRASLCPCTKLMPRLISPADERIAFKDRGEMIAYVRTLWTEGKIYRDLERAQKFVRLFAERDGAHYHDQQMKKEGLAVAAKRVDDKQRKEFQDRSINLDETIIRDSLNESGASGSGGGGAILGEGVFNDADKSVPEPASGGSGQGEGV